MAQNGQGMDPAVLDDIINRLLEFRQAKSVRQVQVQLSEAEIRQLCAVSREIFLQQPNLLELKAPIKICGSSLNGLASNLPDSTGRSFATSFSAQSGAASPVFHHTGTIQGLHNLHESFNVPNMPGTLASRNSTINNVPSSWVQQPTGSLSNILWKLTWSFRGDK
ncbi:unnamed protein product [Camellia sinensis]